MPSRWQKRSQEEKDRIKKNAEEIKEFHPRDTQDLERKRERAEVEKAAIKRIFEMGKVPQLCLRCYKICHCETYYLGHLNLSPELKSSIASYGRPPDPIVVGGICSECGGATCRAFPLNDPDNAILYASAIPALEKEGKLIRGTVADEFLQAAWDAIMEPRREWLWSRS